MSVRLQYDNQYADTLSHHHGRQVCCSLIKKYNFDISVRAHTRVHVQYAHSQRVIKDKPVPITFRPHHDKITANRESF